ncbi:hypothetical protein TWF730_007070 [Orbilia blumenaviensis]|uniref:F-box domain-containing protein n=1 Tax=Orbilia blumenaviensis TaxID=1796055 RepID=A0AAV9VMD6_9PEZI
MADNEGISPDPGPEFKLSKLENLPYDVKYLILENLPDHETLLRFSQSSRVFYNIFRGHRRALFQHLMFNEASEYREESYLLACLGDQLSKGIMSVAELDILYQTYSDSLPHTTYQSPWYYTEVLRGGVTLRTKICENHRGIIQHCERFMQREMKPRMEARPLNEDRVEPPPTNSERRRVMQALYKIWLLLKLHHVRVSEPEKFAVSSVNIGTQSYPLRADIARYLKLWDYWDLKVVQVLLPIFWNDMKAKYDKRGEHLIRMALCRHELACRDDYTYFVLFLNATLHLYFPHTGLKWISRSSNETEIRKHIQNVAEFLSDEDQRSHFETLGDFTGIAYIYFQQIHGSTSGENGFPGPEVFDSIPLKRLCRPGRAMDEYTMQGPEGKRRFLKSLNHASLAQADLQSCMWDDWRLESWGYFIPNFSSSGVQASSRPVDMIEDQLSSITM